MQQLSCQVTKNASATQVSKRSPFCQSVLGNPRRHVDLRTSAGLPRHCFRTPTPRWTAPRPRPAEGAPPAAGGRLAAGGRAAAGSLHTEQGQQKRLVMFVGQESHSVRMQDIRLRTLHLAPWGTLLRPRPPQ